MSLIHCYHYLWYFPFTVLNNGAKFIAFLLVNQNQLSYNSTTSGSELPGDHLKMWHNLLIDFPRIDNFIVTMKILHDHIKATIPIVFTPN